MHVFSIETFIEQNIKRIQKQCAYFDVVFVASFVSLHTCALPASFFAEYAVNGVMYMLQHHAFSHLLRRSGTIFR
jgi:hypothetical protein